MKILLTCYHNPNFIAFPEYVEDAIKALGHELISFDDREFIFPGRLRKKFSFLQNFDLKRLNNKLVSITQQNKPDLLIVLGGNRILSLSIKKIKGAGIKTILWTTDIPNDFDNILETSSLYDYIFCAGTETMPLLKDANCKNVYWLPFACDENLHKDSLVIDEEKKELGRDVVFVGSYYPNRAKILESLADYNIGIWGPNWDKIDKKSPLKDKIYIGNIDYGKWMKIYNSSKIILTLHYNDGKIPCDQASPRLYEALACKCFTLVDNQKDAKILFRDKEHVVFFDNEIDLKEKINFYLNNKNECEKISLAGNREVLDKHTYKHRIQEILFKIKE